MSGVAGVEDVVRRDQRNEIDSRRCEILDLVDEQEVYCRAQVGVFKDFPQQMVDEVSLIELVELELPIFVEFEYKEDLSFLLLTQKPVFAAL